jgi:hypothetical protein
MSETSTPTIATSGGRGRGFAAWTILVVAALLLPIALTAFWAQRTLVDTERYIATVAPLAKDPTIQQAVGDKVSSVLIEQIDAGNRLQNVLPPQLAPLAPLVAGGVNNFVEQQVDQILKSPKFADVWEGINRRLQASLIKALSGDPDGAVTIQGDQVILDTGDLIEIVKQRLVDRGLSWAANIPVPPLVDRQVVILTSPQLATARTAYAIGQPVAQWLIWVVILLFIVAVVVSTRRARMIIGVGVAFVLAAIVLKLGLAFGQNELALTLAGTPFELAQQAFFTILTQFLVIGVRAMLVLGIVLVLVGWFLSGTKAAGAARGLVSSGTSGAGSRLSTTALGPVGAFFARTRRAWQVLVVVIAAVVLVASDQLTGSTILWTLVFAVVALVALEVLAAAAPSEAAEDEVEATEKPAEAAASSG